MATHGSTERSSLREFLASISTIKGDLSNITAPPFLLASQSTVQFPSYWVERPAQFVAPAKESEADKRMVLVLKWFLASLKRQQYAGREPSEGVKKPLNAFLGEVFLADWNDEEGETRLISEQVSHHPPITACYLWNDKHGVRAEGFACQRITFSGSVNIKQMGYAIIHIDRYDEDYLIPLPDVKVSGLITGTPYPELTGSYDIVSSAGYVAEIEFSGKGILGIGGKKNGFTATVHATSHPSTALYTAEGAWSDGFIVKDAHGTILESYDYDTKDLTRLTTLPIEEQDPWESQRAWDATTTALDHGNMQAASDAKSKIEQGQRRMRTEEQKSNSQWSTVFFKNESNDSTYAKLAAQSSKASGLMDSEFGFWKFTHTGQDLPQRPFHKGLTPQFDVQTTQAEPDPVKSRDTSESAGTARQSFTRSSQDRLRHDVKAEASTGNVGSPKISNPYSSKPLDPRVDKLS